VRHRLKGGSSEPTLSLSLTVAVQISSSRVLLPLPVPSGSSVVDTPVVAGTLFVDRLQSCVVFIQRDVGMAGGDGWWAAPLAPLSPTRSLPPRPLIDLGFAVKGAVAGERGGPSRAFASSSTCASFFSAGSFEFYPAGVFPAGGPEVEMKRDGDAYAAEGVLAGEDPVSMACIQSAKSKVSLDTSTEHFGTLAQMLMQTDYEGRAGFSGEVVSKGCPSDSVSDMEASVDAVGKGKRTAVPSCNPGILSDELQLEEHTHGNDVSQHLQDEDQAGVFSLCPGRPSDDGFNWRKYGQKQVKGSEYPRSYYKCTHPNCQVKKKVERSYDGQITEIIYKGKHNHPKPQPARRTIIGSSFPLHDMETPEKRGSPIKTESESVWSNHYGSEDDISTDCQPDGLERMSSTSALTDLSDPMSTAIEKHLGELESTGNLDLSSSLTCHDDDDQVTQDSMPPLDGDDEDDKSDSKRRTNESYLMETGSASRAVREPRVVVQTESEVDILDDGYRWRKYGQKVVKGNPNPRSYYKCTNPGCSVRKHVERAAHDLKSVITTYEGKHNHEVPVARNISSSSGSFPPACNAQSSMILPGSTVNPEHTTSGKDLAPHFKRKHDLSNEYVKQSYPGSLCADTRFGPASGYETKLFQQLAFQPPGPGPSINHAEMLQTSSVANPSPEFPIPFQRALNTGMDGVGVKHGAASSAAAQSLHARQVRLMDLQFLKAPKQEPKDEAFCSSVLPMNNLASASPSLCGQMMGGYPLQ
ncbi:hypothetical protein Taro_016431, partial [Colocasia esculenta]|nr:hypothetical protein [Colocasia esculenta]